MIVNKLFIKHILYDHLVPTTSHRIKVAYFNADEVITSGNCIHDTRVLTVSTDIISVVLQYSVLSLCVHNNDDEKKVCTNQSD